MAVPHPEGIVSIYTSDFSSTQYGTSSYPDFVDFQGSDVLAGLAASQMTPLSMNAGADTEMVFDEVVSGTYFPTLGVEAARGRSLGETDDAAGAAAVAVISHGLWTRRFGSDPAIVGRTLHLNTHPFTIVGVLPRTYTGAMRGLSVDAWIPIEAARAFSPGRDWTQNRGSRGLLLIGRLRPGVTVTQAQAAFDVIAARLYAAHPQQWRTIRDTGRAVSVVPERRSRVHPDLTGPVAGFITLLMAVVALVLLTACANVANLLLARGAARTREIGVRLALGARGSDLLRLVVGEGARLTAIGLAIGLAAAAGVTRFAASLLYGITPTDIFSFGGASAVLLGAALLACYIPALRAVRVDPVVALKSE